MKKSVIGIGEALWDISQYSKTAGGAPVNFVYHAVAQGCEGTIITAIGNDELGNELIDTLHRNHLNPICKQSSFPTGIVNITFDDKRVPSYEIVENTAWDNIELTDEAISAITNADCVCFGTLAQRSVKSRTTIQTLVKYAKPEALIVFDINLRQNYYSADIIHQSLEIANILKINDEELIVIRDLFQLSGNDDEIINHLISKYSLKFVILTAGSKYSAIFSNDGNISIIQTPQTEAIDTVGAGDSFAATFISTILNGENIKTAHDKAVRCAAWVCTQQGAWSDYNNQCPI